MDESENAGGGVSADNQTGMAYGLGVVATAEQHKVAGVEIAGVAYLDAHAPLTAAVGWQLMPEFQVEVTGEAGTVEALGCLAAVVVGGAEVLLGHGHKHQTRIALGHDIGLLHKEDVACGSLLALRKADVPATVGGGQLGVDGGGKGYKTYKAYKAYKSYRAYRAYRSYGQTIHFASFFSE